LLRLINSFSYDVWIWRCRNEWTKSRNPQYLFLFYDASVCQ
jgi:hypothetical protein